MTTTKQNTNNSSYLANKFFPWAQNRLLFLWMHYLKWMHNFKSWFNRFFLYSGMRIRFLLSTGINLYSFGHKERVDLFVCYPHKCERTSAFLIPLPNWFLLCLNSDKKILPLCYEHISTMSSCKIRGKSH